jgi:hypothetical protein
VLLESNVFAGAGRHDERGHPQASAAYITEDDFGGAVHQRGMLGSSLPTNLVGKAALLLSHFEGIRGAERARDALKDS